MDNKSILNSHKKGFTLIEIVLVIGLLGILATTLLVIINPVRQIQKSGDSRRKAELKQIQASLELYRSDFGNYPAASSNNVQNCGNALMDPACNTSTYLQNVPRDPVGRDYYYALTSNGYNLYGCAQVSTDPEAINAPSAVSASYGSTCPSNRVFVVTNP